MGSLRLNKNKATLHPKHARGIRNIPRSDLTRSGGFDFGPLVSISWVGPRGMTTCLALRLEPGLDSATQLCCFETCAVIAFADGPWWVHGSNRRPLPTGDAGNGRDRAIFSGEPRDSLTAGHFPVPYP